MPRGMQITIVALGLLALSACGRGGANPSGTPVPTQGATVSIANATAASATVAPVPTVAATPVPDTATATPRPAPSAATTVRATAAPPTPTPLAARSPTAAPTAPPTAVPPTPTPGAPRVTQIPAAPPRQVVGAATDGLVLLNVRAGTHDGYTRLVFDFAKADGSAAPVPHAQMWTQNGAVILMIGGVRQDAFGETLGTGDEPIETGSVVALYRIPTMDDATVAYGISTKGPANATLTTATGPARLILDIAD